MIRVNFAKVLKSCLFFRLLWIMFMKFPLRSWTLIHYSSHFLSAESYWWCLTKSFTRNINFKRKVLKKLILPLSANK